VRVLVILGPQYYGAGGGVHVNGVANFEGCNIHDNTADGGGGLYISGTATLTNTNVYSNQAAGWPGGGLRINGIATLTNTNVYSNEATDSVSACVLNLPRHFLHCPLELRPLN